jgi:nitrile hydratase accessory protein
LKRSDEPPFTEPWHAQVFALTHKLAHAGHFAWPEWAACFAAALDEAQRNGAPPDGSAYYDVWLQALEAMLIDLDLASDAALGDLAQAWAQAYRRTPHGQPVALPRGQAEPGTHV